MLAVQAGSLLNTLNPVITLVTNTTLAGDLAFSDIFPKSTGLTDSQFDSRVDVGVVPFVFAKSPGTALNGVNGLTREQAVLLLTAGGLMPANYLGGSGSSLIYAAGRDSGS